MSPVARTPPASLLIEGATYAVNPEPVFVPPTGNDLALHRDATYRMRFDEFFDAACRGDVDRMFLSGGQIDVYGNTNVTAIGAMPRPKIKLGGGGGGANISATIGALTLWTTRHRSGRTLVPTLDFLTDLGHATPPAPGSSSGTPAEGLSGSSPSSVSSTSSTGGPGWSRGSRTSSSRTSSGRRASSSRSPPISPSSREPTVAELAEVRAVDPLGVRRSEFSEQELARTFGAPG